MSVDEPTWQWEALEVFAVNLPLKRPLKTASHTISRRRLLVLRVTLRSGDHTTEGYGDISLLDGWTDLSRHDCVETLSHLSQQFSSEPLSLFDELNLPAPIAFGLQVALCDAMARHQGLPLWKWLNPDAKSSVVPLQRALGDAPLDETLDAVDDAMSRGFRCIKLKIGRRPMDADIERIRAIRKAHPALMLRLDANCAYSLGDAQHLIEQLAPLNIDLIEEPLRRDHWPDMAALLEASSIPIAADERLRSLTQGRRLLDEQKADRLVLKPAAFCPYVAPWEQQEAMNSVILSSLIESAIGRHALAHLAAAHPYLQGPQGLATGDWMARDLHPGDDPIIDGGFQLGDTPGLGFEPQWLQGAQPVDLALSKAPWSAFFGPSRAPEDRLAFSFDGDATTYGQWRNEGAKLALHLHDTHGVEAGDTVALSAPNSAKWPVAALAIWWLGATLVPIPADHPDLRIQSLISKAGAQLHIDEPTLAELIAQSRSIEATAAPPEPYPFDDSERFTLLFTSGSTGEPRAVPATVANHRASAFASALRLQNHRRDHWLCCLSMGHIGGLAILLRSLFYGTSFEIQRRFEPQALLSAISQSHPPVTCLSLVPTMLHRLMAHDFDAAQSHLQSVLIGGGPIPADLMRRARQKGWPVLPTYGMTEACSQLTTLAHDEAGLHTAGRPLPGVQIQIGDDGLVAARGPMLSAAHTDEEGWMITGDVAHLDAQSRLVIDHRQSARIVSGGKNVDPTRVESALQSHPAVERAVVIGLDDPEWGQQVAVAITVTSGQHPPSLEDLCAAADDLAAFETPRRLAVIDTFPTTATGKLCRQTLRAQWPEDRITPPQ